jgi:hypothetical protein
VFAPGDAQEHTAPVGKFPLPVVGALVDWFVYNSSNASELQNIFKEKVAATLHQTYYKGILTDYLLRDKVRLLPPPPQGC